MELHGELSDDLRRETEALRRIARGILLEPGLAEDAVQEVWLAALRIDPRAAVSGGWLNQAVQRIARGLRRREKRQAARERAGARTEALPSAADSAARVELLRELLGALGELDEPYRAAAHLRLVEGLSPREIAARTDVPLETARTHVKRAVEKLRAKLDARHAHRRMDFLGALAPLAGFDPSGVALGALAGGSTIGGTLMGIQVKLGVAALIALTAGFVFWRPWSSETGGSELAKFAADPELDFVDERSVDADAVKETSGRSTTQRATVDVDRQATGVDSTNTWVVRGKTIGAQGQALANVDVRVVITPGYEGIADALLVELVRASDGGEFSLALPPPTATVRVHASVVHPTYISFAAERLMLRGAEAPTDLVVRNFERNVTLRGRVLSPERQPVAGASVEVPGQVVECDEEGRFNAISSSHFGDIDLIAWHDGFAEHGTTVQANETGSSIEDIEIVLRPQGVLSGRVVDDRGHSVRDAELTCFAVRHVRSTTGADGRFELRGLPVDRDWLGIGVRANGFAHGRLDLSDGRVPIDDVEIVLARGIELVGRIVDDSGKGLPGSSVWFGRSEFDVHAVKCVAGDDGHFVLKDAPRARQFLHATRSGFAPASLELDARESATLTPITLVLSRGRTVSGIVVDDLGAPLEKMSVHLLAAGEYLEIDDKTDHDGRFELRNAPEHGDLQIECYGTGFVRTTVKLDNKLDDVRVEMPRAAGLTGRVVDASTGDPITHFRVRFMYITPEANHEAMSGYSSSWAESGREFRDQQGRWTTAGEALAAGMVTSIEITAVGYGATIVPRAVTSLDSESTPIVTELSAPVGVRGDVVDARTGIAVSGAVVRRVSVRENGVPLRAGSSGMAERTITNPRGEFEFDQLPPVPTWLVVEAPGYAPFVDGTFEPDALRSRRRIELVPGATLRGVLRDGAGLPQPNQTVQMGATDPRTEEHRTWRAQTDSEGRFEFTDLAAGRYQVSRELRWDSMSVFDLAQTVDVQGIGVFEVELRPRGTCRIAGIVRTSGTPITGVMSAFPVHASAEAQQSRATFIDDSRFVLDGLTPGRWQLSFHEHGRVETSRYGSLEVQVVEGRDEVVTVDAVER